MKKRFLRARVILLCLLMGYFELQSIAAGYDSLVLSHHPVGYWMLIKGYQSDASGHGMTGAYFGGGRGEAILPNGETASIFNGIDNYFQVPDNDYLEVTRTGVMTIEAWVRPDVEDFPDTEGDGYVHWMGKGTASNHLWVARLYNKSNASRPQRMSGYCFNLNGGLGTGSYFQDVIPVGTWIHYVLVINTINTSAGYPTGYTKIYRDGIQRDMDRLDDYSVVPGNGNAPLRMATRDLASFFKGAIGKVALYDYELTTAQINGHNSAMREVALPVQFGSVKASYVNDHLKVKWKTLTEINTDHYLVQVSENGRYFKTISAVQTKSASSLSNQGPMYEIVTPIGSSFSFLVIASFWGLLGGRKSKTHLFLLGFGLWGLFGVFACNKNSIAIRADTSKIQFARVISVDKDGAESSSETVSVTFD